MSTENLRRLLSSYRSSRDNGFALFLGAGVNGGLWAKDHPACCSWPELIKDVAKHFYNKDDIDAVLKASGNDWIKAATDLFRQQDRGFILDQIDNAIYRDTFTHPEKRIGRDAKHKVLEWKVFKKMETLRAVVAFSAAINKTTKKRSMYRNPKVGCILTTNYDFFFSAAWPRYTSMKNKWWPRTWKSQSYKSNSACPIVYLHGYLPYSKKGDRDLILLEEDYENAYQAENSKRFVLRELTDAIENCNLIFIGFSFADQQVINVLKSAKSSTTHFTFLHKKDDAQAIDNAAKLGVLPIEVNTWNELPEKIGQVYCSGITEKELERTNLSRDGYWTALWNRQEPRK
ncbi:MAG TPA: SIR2 family protein [Anaerolineales bacterium]